MDYPGIYTDAQGREQILITSDGETLRTKIRAVEFIGNDFDGLSPGDATPTEYLGSFTLNRGELCACVLSFDIRVPILAYESEVQGTLGATLDLGAPTANGGISHERLLLVLEYAEERVLSSGKSGWFEGELLDIQRRLPDGVLMKACINCLYSDYSPYGHGLFGSMMCFRNLKDEYLRVNSKDDFWAVHSRQERMVQETYLCSDFVRRVPGTGYRG